MSTDPMKIGILVILFIAFLTIPSIDNILHGVLDTLPMRLAAIITILALIPYDRFIALAIFLVITGLYVHHHQEDLKGVFDLQRIQSLNSYKPGTNSPSVFQDINKGGHAEEVYDTMDFVPKIEDQDNKFTNVGDSQDEKHALITEPLGEKSQSLFPEDMKHAEFMEHGNKLGL